MIPQFQAPVQAPVQHNSVPTLYCNGHAFSNLWNQCGFQFPKLRIQLIIWPSLPKAAPRSFEYKVNHQAQTGHLAITSKNKIGEKHLEQHCSTVVDQTGKPRVFPRLLFLLLATPGLLDEEKLPLLLYSLSRVITKVEKVLNSNDL